MKKSKKTRVPRPLRKVGEGLVECLAWCIWVPVKVAEALVDAARR